MHSIPKYKLTFMGILAGALADYAYYHFIGCATGACLITSRPINSTLYGALMGGLLSSAFKKNNQNDTDHERAFRHRR